MPAVIFIDGLAFDENITSNLRIFLDANSRICQNLFYQEI